MHVQSHPAPNLDSLFSQYELKKRHPVMGSALVVSLSTAPQKGAQIKLKVIYSTTNECTAIGWLDKEQTAGKKFDYLFSQCQAVSKTTSRPVHENQVQVDPCAIACPVARRVDSQVRHQSLTRVSKTRLR